MSEYRIAREREKNSRNYPSPPFDHPPASSSRLIPSILYLIAAIIPASANPVSISFDQSALLPGWYDASLSLKSPLIDASLAFRGGDRLEPPDEYIRDPVNPCTDPELRYWSLTARPTRFCAITAGSLSLSGLPARANNPFFALTSTRYTPLVPTNAPIVRAGTNLDSDNLAVECAARHWKIAAAGSPRSWLDDPAWVLAGAFLGSHDTRGGKLSLSAFYGANTVESRAETAWFRDDAYRPRASLTVSGTEAVFSWGGASLSATALTSSGPFRGAEWLVRSDCSLSTRHLALSGGLSRSSAGFTPLDGRKEPYLCREFLAPAVALGNHRAGTRAKSPDSGHAGLSVGGIAIRDIERRERFYLDDREVFALGGFCALSVFALDIESECLTRKGMTDIEGKIRAGTANFPLSFAASAKTTVPNLENGFSMRADSKVSAGIAWKSAIHSLNLGKTRRNGVRHAGKTILEAGLSGTETRANPDDSPVYSLGIALGLKVSGDHLNVRALVEATHSTGDSPWEGKIGLETTLK